MINVRIDEDDLLDMLMNRVSFWTDDDDTLELFSMKYQRDIEEGFYNGAELDVMAIVDNDYINWFDVVHDDDLDNYIDDVEERIEASYNGWNLVYCG